MEFESGWIMTLGAFHRFSIRLFAGRAGGSTRIAIALLAAGASCPNSSAAIASAAIVVGGPTTTSTGTLVITQDIVYTLTSGGFPAALVLDEWTASNGESITTYTDLLTPLKFTLNGSPVTTISSTGLGDNVTSPNNDFTIHDGFFIINGIPRVVAGDQLTLKAGSYVLSKTNPAQGVFNPLATQTFTGNTFLTNSAAGRISSNGQVIPETSSALLLVASCGFLLFRRIRRPWR
jgi:hypothetical protein